MDVNAADLWLRITQEEALHIAWAKVAANEGSPGGDGVTLRDFADGLFANLIQLRADLLDGTYRSGPFRKVALTKRKGGYRVLTIPTIRDRVVQTSIANTLTPIFEAVFEDSSFAYRPNRGVVHAVERIEQWHRRGYDVVIEADVISYFDNIAHPLLFEKLRSIVESLPSGKTVMALIERIVAEQGTALGTPGRGLAQGSPLSPLFANIYLDTLDEEMDTNGVKIVRFADDFVILCKTRSRAERALEHCTRILDAHGRAHVEWAVVEGRSNSAGQ